MIKIALKHWIYDYCINLIFKGIASNFTTFNIKSIKKGDWFRIIEDKNHIYHRCEIIDMNKNDITITFERFGNYNDTIIISDVKHYKDRGWFDRNPWIVSIKDIIMMVR
jgi:hypothetical protein